MKTFLITGSRSYTDKDIQMFKFAIAEHIGLTENALVVHGGAPGADHIANELCKYYSIPTKVIRPVNPKQKISYLYRNAEMIGMADVVLVFWDGESRGTKFTSDYALARGKEVRFIDKGE